MGPFLSIAINLGVAGGLWAINKYLLPDDKEQKDRPEGMEFPLTTVGRPISIVYGTCRVDDLTLVWYGNRATYQNVSPDLAWNYRSDLLFAIGTPPLDSASSPWSSWTATFPPKLRRVWYGDQPFMPATPVTHENFAAMILDLGGRGGGGDLNCDVEFFDGRSSQQVTSYPSGTAVNKTDQAFLNSAGGSDPIDRSLVPGYRCQMLMSMLTSTGAISIGTGSLGESPRIPAVSAEVSAVGPQPSGPKGEFGETLDVEANPVWVIYDLLVSPKYRVGYSASDIDIDSWQACADTLETEGHGCSIVISQIEEAPKIAARLALQIDAVIDEDPTTGKIAMRLIRSDYDPEAIQVIDKTNAREPKLRLVGWIGTTTNVTVRFPDRAKEYKYNTTSAKKMANAAIQGNRQVPIVNEYPGCATLALAAKLAQRDLAVLGRPLMTATVVADRELHELRVGTPVLCDWSEDLGIEKVFRVLDVDDGDSGNGDITIELIEDVFDNAAGAFEPVTPAEIPPYLLPIHERYLSEAPWFFIDKLWKNGVVTDNTLQHMMALAVNEDDAIASRYREQIDGLPWDDVPQTNFVVSGTVAVALPRTAEPVISDTLTIDAVGASAAYLLAMPGATDLQMTAGSRLGVLFHDDDAHEIIAFDDATYVSDTDGVVRFTLDNVWRGVLDTAAIDHPAGVRFMFLSTDAIGRWKFDPASISSLDVSVIPSGSGLIGSGDDPVDTVDIGGRASRPYPAVDVSLYGPELEGTLGSPAELSPSELKRVTHFSGAAELWAAGRSRLTASVLRPTLIGEPLEAGTTFDVVAQRANVNEAADAEVVLQTGLTTAEASGILLGAAGHGEIDVKFRSLRSGLASYTDPTVRATAPRWRNLLRNSEARLSYTTIPDVSGWTNVVGTVGADQGVFSLSQKATGTWFESATSADGLTTFRQDVDVSGYQPERMRAVCDFYYRNQASDVDDAVTVTLVPLDNTDTPIDSGENTGALVGDPDLWQRGEVEYNGLPAGTVKLRVQVHLDGNSNTAVSHIRLRLGQLDDQLLENPSFDAATGTLTMTMDGTPEPVIVGATLAVDANSVVGGVAQTNLSMQVTLTWSGGGTRPASAPSTVDLDGWTLASAWAQVDSDKWRATFTRASQDVGTTTVQFTVGAGATTGTITVDVDGSSQEIPEPTENSDAITVSASYALTYALVWSSGSITEGDTNNLLTSITVGGGTQNSLTLTVLVGPMDTDGPIEASSPAPAITNLNGWTLSSSGTVTYLTVDYYRFIFTLSSLAVGTTDGPVIQVDTMEPGTAYCWFDGTNGSTEVAGAAQSGNGSSFSILAAPVFDSLVTTPTHLSTHEIDLGDLGSTPLPCTVTATASGQNQTNGYVKVEVYDSYGAGGLIDSIGTDDLAGWTQTGAWTLDGMTGIWSGIFEKSTVDIGSYEIDFTIEFAGNTGQIFIRTNGTAPQTSQDAGSGNAIEVDINEVSPSITWTVDATSGKACPANTTEWGDFISYYSLSIAVPDWIYLFDEGSGNLTDEVAGKVLTASGTTGHLGYGASESGWSRPFVTFTDNGSGYFGNTTFWPATLSANSSAVLLYARLTATPSADRHFLAVGGSEFGRLSFSSTPRMKQFANANTATGSSDPSGAVRPYFWRCDVTSSENRLSSDQETLVATFDAPNLDDLYIGGGAGTGAGVAAGYGALWYGSNAEISSANMKATQTAAGWSPSY